MPGTRVAANISGINHESIERGQILTDRGWLRESRALDVRLRVVQDSPVSVKHRASVTLHLGTSETLARVQAAGPSRSWSRGSRGGPSCTCSTQLRR